MSSSNFLIDRLLRSIDFDRTLTIAELGVGSGCVTREILRRMVPHARLVSLEVNPAFIEACQGIHDDRLTLRLACATGLPDVLDDLGIEEVDCIVSSLPLAILDSGLVDRILEGSRGRLKPDGRFLQYQYSLKHLPVLKALYGRVGLGFTFRNVPPAFVYECVKRGKTQNPPAPATSRSGASRNGGSRGRRD